MTKNVIESGRAYRHGTEKPCTSAYITPVIISLCRKYGAKKIIDLGCGNGSLCRNLVDAGFQAAGMDPSETGIVNAGNLVPEGTFRVLGVYDNPPDMWIHTFDVAVSTEVVEHLFKPSALLEFASKVLKKDGLLVVSTPYHGYLKNMAICLVNGWDRHHSPLWDGGHIKFWSRRSLSVMLSQYGYEVLEFHGVGRIPFLWKSMVITARRMADTVEN